MDTDFAEEELVENPTLKAAYNLAPLHHNQPLRWDYEVHLLGEKITNKVFHLCEVCELPILVYGRMLPCKHIFCFDCARKCEKTCKRCEKTVEKVEKSAVGTVYVCTHGAPKHSTTGCRRTYLSQRDLQSHIAHRHLPKPPVSETKHQASSQSVPPQLPMTQQQAAQQQAAHPAIPQSVVHCQSLSQQSLGPALASVHAVSHVSMSSVQGQNVSIMSSGYAAAHQVSQNHAILNSELMPAASSSNPTGALDNPLMRSDVAVGNLPIGVGYLPPTSSDNSSILGTLEAQQLTPPHLLHPQLCGRGGASGMLGPKHMQGFGQMSKLSSPPMRQQSGGMQQLMSTNSMNSPIPNALLSPHMSQQHGGMQKQMPDSPIPHQQHGLQKQMLGSVPSSPLTHQQQGLQKQMVGANSPGLHQQHSGHQHQMSTSPLPHQHSGLQNQNMGSLGAHSRQLQNNMDNFDGSGSAASMQGGQSRTNNINLITVPIQEDAGQQFRPGQYVRQSQSQSNPSFPQTQPRNMSQQNFHQTGSPAASGSFNSLNSQPLGNMSNNQGANFKQSSNVRLNNSQGLLRNPRTTGPPNLHGGANMNANIQANVQGALAGMIAEALNRGARAQGNAGLMPTPNSSGLGQGNSHFGVGGTWPNTNSRTIQPRMTQNQQRPSGDSQFNQNYFN